MHVLTSECLVPDCLFAHNIKGHLELAMGGLKSPAGWTEKGLIQRWSVSQGCGFPGPSWRLSCKLEQRDNRETVQDDFGREVCQGSCQTTLREQMWVTFAVARQTMHGNTAALIQRKWERGKSSGCSWIQKFKCFYQKTALQTLPHLVFPTYHQQITEGKQR